MFPTHAPAQDKRSAGVADQSTLNTGFNPRPKLINSKIPSSMLCVRVVGTTIAGVAVNQLNETKLGWCAGLFEGEGNIHISTQYEPSITIVNNQRELLEPFLTFGGSVIQRKTGTYQWRIGGNNVVEKFIIALDPHIKSTKNKELFSLAMEFIRFDRIQKEQPMSDRNHKGYEQYRLRFKELHHTLHNGLT